MNIKTLTNIDLNQLLDTFNQSFSGYFVKVQLSKKELKNKLVAESVNLDYSVGTFDGDKLVGFILHGFDIVNGLKTVYNAGTGVVPEYRGKGLTKQMYDYILPILKQNGVKRCLLEVIDENLPAIKTYEKVGFKVSRVVDCYKGNVHAVEEPSSLEFIELRHSDWEVLKSFWDWNPTWQHDITAVVKGSDQNKIIEVLLEGKIVGYAVVNPSRSRVLQFAIDKKYRRKGIGYQLFDHLCQVCGSELSIINVDQTSEATKEFLISIGFESFIQQHEMELIIS